MKTSHVPPQQLSYNQHTTVYILNAHVRIQISNTHHLFALEALLAVVARAPTHGGMEVFFREVP